MVEGAAAHRPDGHPADGRRAGAGAASSARRSAGGRSARVLSSPLSRASRHGRLAGFGDRLELDDDLREWDYGVYEGRTRVDIAAEEPGWTVWSRPIIGGESLEELGDAGRPGDRAPPARSAATS